jgi:NADPH2:quinone reductase
VISEFGLAKEEEFFATHRLWSPVVRATFLIKGQQIMAQVVTQQGWGGTDVLAIEERVVPQPGLGQVALDQKAIGFNYFDVLQRKGILSPNEPGRVMGIEGAGVITAVGQDTPYFSVGDRVAYFRSQGAYATDRLIDASALVKLPDDIGFEDAAAITIKGFMAWLTARKLFAVQPGQTILVTTAAGGIGSLVTRLATFLGAQVIGVVGSSSKRDAALLNGAVASTRVPCDDEPC